jgi:SAM-dependent methyltransferase
MRLKEIDAPIVRGIPGIFSRDQLQRYVIERGCYSPDQNSAIFNAWFAPGPRYLFRAVDRKYGLRNKKLCDIGCAYGSNLVFCQPGSYGLEIEPYEVEFAQSLGLEIHQRDVVHDDVSGLPAVDAAWCSAIVEHLEAPHTFLRKVHMILNPGGLLVVFVPTIPLIPWLKHIPILAPYLTAHQHGDHVNAFSPATLRFTCERAGFHTLEVSPLLPGVLSPFSRVLRRFIDGCVYVGTKIGGWEYPENSTRRVAANREGFMFRGQTHPGGLAK